MKNVILQQIESRFLRKDPLPHFKAGDTLKVWVKIPEGNDKDGKAKFRSQLFEGVCLRYRKGTTNASFMVRKISAGGIGVDRNFLVNSPMIDKVEVKTRGIVRRSRIYYLRDLKGKAARVKSRYRV